MRSELYSLAIPSLKWSACTGRSLCGRRGPGTNTWARRGCWLGARTCTSLVQVPAKRQLGGRAHRPPVFGLV